MYANRPQTARRKNYKKSRNANKTPPPAQEHHASTGDNPIAHVGLPSDPTPENTSRTVSPSAPYSDDPPPYSQMSPNEQTPLTAPLHDEPEAYCSKCYSGNPGKLPDNGVKYHKCTVCNERFDDQKNNTNNGRENGEMKNTKPISETGNNTQDTLSINPYNSEGVVVIDDIVDTSSKRCCSCLFPSK